MTLEEFEAFVTDRKVPIQIVARAPFRLVPCDCRDVNCHGWRFVEVTSPVDFHEQVAVYG
jgi:hypothetical protein